MGQIMTNHVHTGNLYDRKSPAATNSSMIEDQNQPYHPDGNAIGVTRCDTPVLFELALFQNLDNPVEIEPAFSRRLTTYWTEIITYGPILLLKLGEYCTNWSAI